jgi:hypothetical protein
VRRATERAPFPDRAIIYTQIEQIFDREDNRANERYFQTSIRKISFLRGRVPPSDSGNIIPPGTRILKKATRGALQAVPAA